MTYALTGQGALQVLTSSNLSGSEYIPMVDDDTPKSTILMTPANLAQHMMSNTSAMSATDYSVFVGVNKVLKNTVGTWTITRIAQGDMSYRHTAGDETSIMVIDITPELRSTTSCGFKLTSFDYIYKIGTADMDAHSLTFNKVVYSNNVANAVTQPAVTGTLATAVQSNPYVTNVTVDTPAFLNTPDAKYIIEITQNFAATTAFDFYGLVLYFTQKL